MCTLATCFLLCFTIGIWGGCVRAWKQDECQLFKKPLDIEILMLSITILPRCDVLNKETPFKKLPQSFQLKRFLSTSSIAITVFRKFHSISDTVSYCHYFIPNGHGRTITKGLGLLGQRHGRDRGHGSRLVDDVLILVVILTTTGGRRTSVAATNGPTKPVQSGQFGLLRLFVLWKFRGLTSGLRGPLPLMKARFSTLTVILIFTEDGDQTLLWSWHVRLANSWCSHGRCVSRLRRGEVRGR